MNGESLQQYARENYTTKSYQAHIFRPASAQQQSRQYGSRRKGRVRASMRSVPLLPLRTSTLKALVLAGALILALLIGMFASQLPSAVQEADAAVNAVPFAGTAPSEKDERPVSTPRDQWKRGEIPYLFQTDGEWADAPYAGKTVETSGCGPTCLSMVYVALTGESDLDPAAMAAFSDASGHSVDNQTSWTLMTEGSADLGLTSRELPADISLVNEELGLGHPVICSVGKGDFTDTGHFIVISGRSADGQWIVHDPNSALLSARPWEPERILSQCLNLWSFR